MKKYTLLLLCLFPAFVKAQDCIDPSLIDPNAICPMIYAPVCGCDGVTYDNDCLAQHLGGVTSWTDGECQPVSGCIDMSGLDFGMCDMFLGYAWNGSSCVPVSGCGYVIGNIDYSPNFYDLASECQQTCGNVATDCINFSQIEEGYTVDCATVDEAVCGCDGVTYMNKCLAYYIGGVTTFAPGPCSQSSCFVIPDYAHFGDCEMPLGWALTGNGCIQISGCSYIGMNGYDYSSFFFTTQEDCENHCGQCIDPEQIDITIMCAQIYDPVCGCDNITYSNSCEATYHGGVTSFTLGECVNSVLSLSKNNIQVYPIPFQHDFTIAFDRPVTGILTIYDVSGKVQLSKNISGSRITSDAGTLPSGAYLLEVRENSGNSFHQRILKN